ncbi:MAG: hypothetical protein GEV08_21230 [Acidimicrobiia bacterium]|nr:hypothetical protein [Acidimicrobiia bacterium]
MFAADATTGDRPLPDARVLFGEPPATWTDAFGRLGVACRDRPTVVVLDEFPWAAESDPTLEGRLQNAWDRELQHLPVLFVLVGSDVATMERLTGHDRPLYGRARELVVRPFNPAECAEALGSPAPLAVFDAYLVTGGYPRLVAECARAGCAEHFVTSGLMDENSDLAVVGQRSVDAEFPEGDQARRVLSAVGGLEVGHATFSGVAGRLGDDGSAAGTATTRAVKVLSEAKGVLAVDRPVGSARTSRLRRYRITDPYLRFWFRFVERQVPNMARGRADLAVAAFERDWPSWRGSAIEPVVRDALARLAPEDEPLADVTDVGAWWNRDSSHEYDVVAATGRGRVALLGSVKWRLRRPFDAADLAELAQGRSVVPHAEAAKLAAICPAGVDPAVAADVRYTPGSLLGAWPS